jgi:23S rRNA (uracil1939-C5)-methyltransferase
MLPNRQRDSVFGRQINLQLTTNHNPLQLVIEKLVYGGDGLARLPADEQGRGKAAFVPFVLPGEEIEAEITEQKPGFARARLQAVLAPSPHRVEAACPYFQKCGGCHYQHSSYELQLESKAAILKENLRRIAKLELEAELVVHPSPPWNYRNRSRFKVQTAPEFALGYHKFASNELLPVEQCPISSTLINRAVAALWEMGRAGKVIGEVEEVEFFADADDAQLLVEVYCAPGISLAAGEELVQAFRATVPQCSGVVAFRRPAPQTEPEAVASSEATNLQYRTEHGTYRVSAGAFFQVNRHLINALVKLATHGRPGQMALDLYAGAGLFSVPLARSFAQVIAVESSQTSQSDLAYNSPANVRPVRATVEQYLKDAPHKLLPDLVVLDPPRSGLGEGVVRGLAGVKAPRITYVSCDPSTLARDLGGLLKAGYRVEQAHLVDLFPQTFHLETVLQLVR